MPKLDVSGPSTLGSKLRVRKHQVSDTSESSPADPHRDTQLRGCLDARRLHTELTFPTETRTLKLGLSRVPNFGFPNFPKLDHQTFPNLTTKLSEIEFQIFPTLTSKLGFKKKKLKIQSRVAVALSPSRAGLGSGNSFSESSRSRLLPC